MAVMLSFAAVSAAAQTVPDAPSGVYVVPADGALWVNFTAPAIDGGSPVTGYTATCAPTQAGSAVTASGPSSPLRVAVLTNGIEYACSVLATNSVGDSTDSVGSNAMAPTASGALAAGAFHTCAFTVSGEAVCWGNNSYGQLGDGTNVARSTPVAVTGLTHGGVALQGDYLHSCALTSVGGVKCWGYNYNGQLGDGTYANRSIPADVAGLTSGVVAMAAGGGFGCALTAVGGVKCWGDNYYGQLGDGNAFTFRAAAADVAGLTTGVVAIAAGASHACALTSIGGVKCWGHNGYGRLGDGTYVNKPVPVDVNGLASGVVAIAAGGSHTCALTSLGAVKCWGDNSRGQLGDGNSHTAALAPVDVSALGIGVVAIVAGDAHTCALTSVGSVKCWGYNDYGQLGDGTRTSSTAPVDVAGQSSSITAVVAGGNHTCALVATGGVRCWGYNAYGQLGEGTNQDSWIPVDVPMLATFSFDRAALYVSDVATKANLRVVAAFNARDSVTRVNYTSTSDIAGAVYFPVGSLQQALSLPLPADLYVGQNIAVSLATVDPGTAVVAPKAINITVAADRVAYGSSSFSTNELAGTATISVVRSGHTDFGAAAVSYATLDGSAHAGTDYQAVSGTLSWAEGELGAKAITVPILHNQTGGPNPQFNLVLSDPVNTIIDGPLLATVSIRQAEDAYWEGGSLAAGWTQPSGAAAGWSPAADYACGGTLSLKSQPTPDLGAAIIETTGTFRAGTVSFERMVSSEPTVDFLRFYIDGTKMGEWSGEQDWQAFSYPVSAGTHTFRWAYEKDATGSGGLDAAWIDTVTLPLPVSEPALSVQSVNVSRQATTVSVAILRDGDLTGTASVDFATADGSAMAGLDYVPVSGSLLFLPGESSKTVSVALLRPASLQGSEYFRFQLSSPVGVALFHDQAAVRIASDLPDVVAGVFHSCALTSVGGVKCWGDNYYGELGDGTNSSRSVPADVGSLTSGAVAISGVGFHTCALTSVGGVKCWGNNDHGELGDGTELNRATPVDVVGLTSGVLAVAGGGTFTCARTAAGGIKCWGYNYFGQLGDGTEVNRITPTDVIGLTGDVLAISAGGSHVCALTSFGGVKCWGHNGYGQLGDGSTVNRATPTDVMGLDAGVVAITAGQYHTCALTSAGAVKCWGYNYYGQLGSSTAYGDQATPVDVTGLFSGVVAVSAGDDHTCALTSTGGVKCWGSNFGGTLGTGGSNTSEVLPVDVAGLASGVVAIAAGQYHTCALISSGSVMCWGTGNQGQLGNGSTNGSSVPVNAQINLGIPPGPPSGISVTGGNGSAVVSFALMSGGAFPVTAYTASCISSNGGSSGNGTGAGSPILVTALTNGKSYSCTVRAANIFGTGVASAASNTVTPAPTVPLAPTITALSYAKGALKVWFTGSASDGGSPITSYSATCSNGVGSPISFTGSGSPILVTGLSNGANYTCTVRATNAVGESASSAGLSRTVRRTGTAPFLSILLGS